MCAPTCYDTADQRDRGGAADLDRRPTGSEPSAPQVGEQLSLFPDQDFTEPRKRRAANARH